MWISCKIITLIFLIFLTSCTRHNNILREDVVKSQRPTSWKLILHSKSCVLITALLTKLTKGKMLQAAEDLSFALIFVKGSYLVQYHLIHSISCIIFFSWFKTFCVYLRLLHALQKYWGEGALQKFIKWVSYLLTPISFTN